MGIVLYVVLRTSHEVLVENEVKSLGELLIEQVIDERARYIELVQKLEGDGIGVTENFHHMKGFIPLQGQFFRSFSQQAGGKDNTYSYQLLSSWNINKDLGLKDSFDIWAWQKLVEQEKSFEFSGTYSNEAYPWKTVSRIENENGQQVMKLMAAYSAVSQSCVSCHNKLEQSTEIIDYRVKQNQEPRKVFKLHDLMGAVKITIPMEGIRQSTVHIQRDSLVSLSVVLLSCFAILLSLFYVKVINPVVALTSLVKRVSQGDLEVRMESGKIKSSGEIQELTDSFGKMVTDIKAGQDNLKSALIIAEDANNAKSEFLANMSHEIRTPLNAVIGFSNILLDDELSSEQRKMLEIMQSSSNVLLGLINDILDLSKIEAGEMKLEEIPINIEDIIYEVNESLRAKVSGELVELNMDIPDMSMKVLGDPVRFKQIFTNLIGNSIKFTQEGEILTSARVIEMKEDTVKFRFAVKDTGIGINQDKQAMIFDAFQQVDGSITRKYGGTGLGLSITAKIIKSMGGEIQIQSEEKKGSEFYFELEMKKSEILPERDISALDKKSFLTIGESSSFATILQSIVKPSGASIIFEDDHSKVIELLGDKKKDFILFSLKSERSSMYALKDKLEGFGLLENTKCLAIISDLNMKVVAEVKSQGFDAYLTKPLKREVFFSTVLENLETISSDKLNETIFYNNDDFRKANILLVEDNLVNQKITKKMLTKMGHAVDIAENGLIALKMVQQTNYELILMDLQMPVMDGLTATREILGLYPHIQIVALTANAFDTDRESSFEAGMVGFLTKPLMREQLQEVISKTCLINVEAHEKRILIVEDDATSLELMKTVLDSFYPNLIIMTAVNGVEACTKVGSFLPHLIILDLRLPDLDGTGVLEYLSKSDKYKKIDVIILTALSKDNELRTKALEFKNCKAVVEKGKGAELIEKLKELI